MFIYAVNLKNILCNIQSNAADFTHDPSPCFQRKPGRQWHFDTVELKALGEAGLFHQARP